MPNVNAENFLPADDALPTSSEGVNDRLAEAARYAVLRRLLPVLRHDVAGSMQPVRLLMMVLERRVQKADPDLAAISNSVISLSALTKQAAADCMAALAWIDSRDDPQVGLRSAVDEAAKLLAMELAVKPLALVNGVADDSATAPQSFFRSVFIGAVLAFCDQHVSGGALEVTFQEAAPDRQQSGRLKLRMLPGDAGKSPAFPDVVRKPRLILRTAVDPMQSSGKSALARV